MINFRYHLVSLIAVFLALAVGIVMGSTVVDQAIVDGLRGQIRRVERESDDRKADNAMLREELRRTDDALAEAVPFAVDDRLREIPVLVLAERGVDGDVLQDALDMLRDAGADAPGVVWFNEKWRVSDGGDREELAQIAGIVGVEETVRARAFELLASELVTTPAVTPRGNTANVTTTLPDGATDTAVLTALRDAGFLDMDGDEDAFASLLPTPDLHVLVVGGSHSRLDGTGVLAALASALDAAAVPTVAAEVYEEDGTDGAPERGETVKAIRDDDELAASVSTLDDLELVEGLVAAVLAMQNLDAGVVGHYGYGAGATGPLPVAPSQ